MPEINMNIAILWIDIAWIPILLILAHKKHKIIAIFFVLFCVFTLRMEVELLLSLGIEKGLTGYLDMPMLQKGQIAYAIVTVIYVMLSRFSKHTKPVIYMAASLTIYLFASMLALIVMSL